jgi:hypothetical protein
MPEPSDLLHQLRAARAADAAARRDRQAALLEQQSLRRELGRVARAGERNRQGELEAALQRSAATVAAREDAARGTTRDIAALLGELHRELSPERITALWSADTPILLLPLRVETRFKGKQLLVRVFPDEVAIDTHEELLTKGEAAAGAAYWRAVARADSETARKEAWRKLVEAFKAPRAAYVVRRTRPVNWDKRAETGPDGLVFPTEAVLKEDSWTEAPRVKVLPDRLVLLLSRGGALVHEQVGALIGDVVQAGPSPLQADARGSWSRDKAGDIVFDAGSQWLRDFDVAVGAGLGFRVALGPGDEAGFDELLVVGLKHSLDATDSAARLQELLLGHRYSTKGLALVPQGAATNNTSGEDAALDSVDWFADASYAAQSAGTNPEPPAELHEASDGTRLAVYLGLDPDLLRGVPNAARRDHAEAVAMNAALYPGTLGYFVRSMIGELAGDARLDALRAFHVRCVTGRGPLAAIRVSNQPYGFVLAGPPPRALAAEQAITLDQSIERIIALARPYWTRFLPQLARLGASANASADLLAVLGLQPGAAEYFQRIATTYDHLANLAGFGAGGNRMDEVFAAAFAGFVADGTLKGIGYQTHRADGSAKPYPLLFQLIFQRHQTAIPASALIDGQPFSETEPIKPYNAGGSKNYIDWLLANARDAQALRLEDFGGAAKPSALLYMLLRHALLIQSGTSVNRWLKLFAIEAPELVIGRKFLGMTPAVDIAAWEILSAPAIAIRGTVASDLPLLSMVHLPQYRDGPNGAIGAPLDEMLSAYESLRGLPTARLERLFAEHLDTLSYRLDAWETALADRRLVRRRAQAQDGQGGAHGLYLGAFGYLENVRRAEGRRRPIDEGTLPAPLRGGKGDLYAPLDGAGYVHAPSLNHATAAAVLRNGYLTHATPDDPGRLAVNLSSRRVRRARELMEGVRQGQSLEVLLGIEFERGLHDATTRHAAPVVLNQLKPAFRLAFPIQRTRIPATGSEAGEPQIVPDYTVANGLAIAATADAFPAGTAGLPTLDAAQQAELKAIRDRLRDSLDAVKDLLTAESAYQLALGNFDRAAAIVQQMSAALAPSEPEVARTPRGTDLAFTQRLAIELDPSSSANPWPSIPMGVRAQLEPPLNAWVGAMLGDPSLYACKVTLTASGAAPVATSVRLSSLALQPLDLLRLARGMRDDGGPAELEARVHAAALAATGVTPDATVAIAFADTGPAAPGAVPFADALAMLDLAHQVIGSARPLDGRDALTVSKPLPKGTEPSGIDLAELRARFAALALAAGNLATALAAASTASARRAALRSAADFGLPHAFPNGADDTLAAQVEMAGRALAMLRAQAATLEAASHDAALTPAQQAATLIEAVQALLGADFRLLPRFSAPNAADLAACDATRDAMLAFAAAGAAGADPVGEVLTSVAQVRPAVHRLYRLRLMAELTSGTPQPLAALQLPPRSGDTWLGAALPPGHEIFHDTLSLIQLRPQGFSAGAPRCGLLVDEWTESFPRTSEVTGVAFGFDQPNNAPPQSLLLAVAGEGRQRWSLDDLVAIIRDTMLRAKLRAVEPDMLDTIPGVTTLLPATVAEFSTSPGALSLDFGLAVPLVLAQALASPYFADLPKMKVTP